MMRGDSLQMVIGSGSSPYGKRAPGVVPIWNLSPTVRVTWRVFASHISRGIGDKLRQLRADAITHFICGASLP